MKHAVRSRLFGWLVGLVALFLLALTGNATPFLQQTGGSRDVSKPVDVGMVALIAAPERYEGKVIRTHGFLSLEFENDALYLHEEDYRYGLDKNALALRLPKAQRELFKSLNRKYVVIEGIVQANAWEQRDLWGGAIGNITRLEVWPVDREYAPHK